MLKITPTKSVDRLSSKVTTAGGAAVTGEHPALRQTPTTECQSTPTSVPSRLDITSPSMRGRRKMMRDVVRKENLNMRKKPIDKNSGTMVTNKIEASNTKVDDVTVDMLTSDADTCQETMHQIPSEEQCIQEDSASERALHTVPGVSGIAHPNSTNHTQKSQNKKSKIISSIIWNRDVTKRIHVLKYKDACVHVVDQTYFDTPDPEDECYLALVTIPSPKITSVQKTPGGVNNAGATCDVAPPVEPEIPLEYRDLAAAFDLGEVTLPKHGPQDLAIDLVDGKIPPMGTLYNLSESELLVVQK